MDVRRVVTLCFSATGNTKKLVDAIGGELSARLGAPLESLPFTTPSERAETREFPSDTLVVVGVPVYAGKIPNKLLPDYQTRLRGNGTPAVAVVTFGNRSYDNALAELCAVLDANGFCAVAGGAFVGRHCMSDKLALGRPDERDVAEARAFASSIAAKLETTEAPAAVAVKGDASAAYFTPRGTDGKPVNFLKAKPKTDPSRCVGCGLCARNCPMGSIDPDDVSVVKGVCIKCSACVRNCPAGAKYFDDPVMLDHVAMIENANMEPKTNETFV